MLQRGVTLAFLRRKLLEIDAGQFLNGVHTTSSATDWKEFDRARDGYCGKACTLHTGTSFVEAMVEAELTQDPDTGAPYFALTDTFVRCVLG